MCLWKRPHFWKVGKKRGHRQIWLGPFDSAGVRQNARLLSVGEGEGVHSPP